MDENAAWAGRTTTVGPPPRDCDRSFEGTDLLRRLVDPGQRPGSIGRIDHYEVLSEIGRGAMGIVVRSFDTALERIVAMKLMAPALIPSETARQRFFREARSAAGISHPNVVTIHAVGQFKDVPYLVMEYVDGRSLSERILEGPISIPDVMRISQQIAEGLAAAHNQGLVHRDIKPANILLEDSIERVRIADFGLAKVAMERSDLTSQGDIVGTAAYMSPEQVNGETLDTRSDLFSVGCVMYAMLTKVSPFHAGHALAAAHKVTTTEPRSLSDVCPQAPRKLRELVHTLLQKSREGRNLTAAGLADSLRRLQLEWESNLNLPTASLPRPRRMRSRILVLGLVPLLLLAGLYVVRGTLWPAASAEVRGGGPDGGPGSDAGVNAGVNAGTAAAAPPPPVVRPPRVDGRLWVSADGRAPFTRIAEALADVQPGETIEIEGGTYREPIVLNDPVRHAGIRIRGPGAVFRLEKGKSVVTIDGVPDVEITGLTINARAGQRAILIAGSCPGLRVAQCRLEAAHDDDRGGSLLHVTGGAAGTEAKPIRLDELTLRLMAVGLVCGDSSGPGPARFVRVTRCRFTSPGKQAGIPIILLGELQNILLAGNRLEGGQSPFNLLLPGPRLASEVRFEFNSIFGFHVPINPYDSHPNQGIRYDNNLLIDVDGVTHDERRVGEIAMWFAGNLWELPVDKQTPQAKLIAEMASSVPLQSRDAANPAFLVPVSKEQNVGHSRFVP